MGTDSAVFMPSGVVVQEATLRSWADKDPIIQTRGGRVTAKRIKDARYVELPGIGLDLPQALWRRVAHEVRTNADLLARP